MLSVAILLLGLGLMYVAYLFNNSQKVMVDDRSGANVMMNETSESEGIADDAIFVLHRLSNIVIDQDFERTILNLCVCRRIPELEIVELLSVSHPMHIPARGALNLKILAQRVLPDRDDFLALRAKTLKYLENDVSHVLDMFSPY